MTLSARLRSVTARANVGDPVNVKFDLTGVVAFDSDHPIGFAVDWGDGASSDLGDSVFFDPTQIPWPITYGWHAYTTAGTYTVTVTISSPGSADVVLVGRTTVSGSLRFTPGDNRTLATARTVRVPSAPGTAVLTPYVSTVDDGWEPDEPSPNRYGDGYGDALGSVWYRIPVTVNTVVYLNWIAQAVVHPELPPTVYTGFYRQEGDGIAGLWQIDQVAAELFDGEDDLAMTYTKHGRLLVRSAWWWGWVMSPGVYYLQVAANQAMTAQLELHQELLQEGHPPRAYVGGQPRYGGTPAGLRPTVAKQGTVLAGQLTMEGGQYAIANVFFGHTDDDGFFFYDWADPKRRYYNGELAGENIQLDIPTAAVIAGTGELVAFEQVSHDIGAHSQWYDHAPAAGRVVERIRGMHPRGGFWYPPVASIVRAGSWHFDGVDVTDEGLSNDGNDIIKAHDGRGTFFAYMGPSTDPGVIFDYPDMASYRHRFVEFEADGTIVNNFDVNDDLAAILAALPDSGGFVVDVAALPDDDTHLWVQMQSTSGGGWTTAMKKFNLNTHVFTDSVAAADPFARLRPVQRSGEWCWVSLTHFQRGAVTIYDRDLTAVTTVDELTTGYFGTRIPAWGAPRPYWQGVGQEGTRLWLSAFQPQADPPGTGRALFSHQLVFYDIDSATWHDAGLLYSNDNDSIMEGGQDINYFDVYEASSGLILPAPPTTPLDLDGIIAEVHPQTVLHTQPVLSP